MNSRVKTRFLSDYYIDMRMCIEKINTVLNMIINMSVDNIQCIFFFKLFLNCKPSFIKVVNNSF